MWIAKSTVRQDDVDRLLWRMNQVEIHRGVRTIGFLGGPRFHQNVQAHALKHGIQVVLVSGLRYEIFNGDDDDEQVDGDDSTDCKTGTSAQGTL